jgi:hypothetical protein
MALLFIPENLTELARRSFLDSTSIVVVSSVKGATLNYSKNTFALESSEQSILTLLYPFSGCGIQKWTSSETQESLSTIIF